MKILIITNLFDDFVIGGYELGCQQFAKFCDENGHHVTILTARMKNEIKSFCNKQADLVLHENWGFDSIPKLDRIFVEQRNLQVVRQLLKSSFDKVFVWNGDGLGIELFNYLIKDDRCRFYFMDRSFFRYHKFFRLKALRNSVSSYTQNYKFPNLVVQGDISKRLLFVSHDLAKRLYQFADKVIYPGFTQYHSVANFQQRKKIKNLVFVGQLTPQKGIFNLIKFIGMFNHKNSGDPLKLTIFTKHVEKTISENAFITIKTDVNYQKIRQMLSSFDAAVFPSIWREPLSFVMPEYVDAGLPVLTSGRGGSIELFDEKDLYIFNPESFDSFESAVVAMRLESSLYRLEQTKNNKTKLSKLCWSDLLNA